MLKPGPQIQFIVPKGLRIFAPVVLPPKTVDATASAGTRVVLQAVRTSNTY